MADPDKVVLTAGILTLGSTVSASILPAQYGGHGQLPSAKLLVGTGLTFMGLSMLADFAPAVSGPLAFSVAITALTYYGIPIMDNFFTGTNTNPVGKAPTGPGAHPATG